MRQGKKATSHVIKMESPNKPRKIRNPLTSLSGYNCFGCNPDNPSGLQMKFVEQGGEILSVWKPKNDFQGYFEILHGGIQAALMDEIASWVVYVKLRTAGFTSRVEVRYHKTVYVNKGEITLRARSLRMRRNLADIEVKLFDHEEKLCASGLFTYFTFPIEKARETMNYPAHDHFYEDEE